MGNCSGNSGAHTLIYPRFTINDLQKAKPHLDGMVEATKAEEGCLYYGWTICGNKLQCRETYVDGEAVAEHLASAGPLVGKMLESGAASLDSLGVMGTEDDLAECQEAADELKSEYWEVWSNFQNFKIAEEEQDSTANFVTIQPTFSIIDIEQAEPFMQQCVDITKTEGKACLYYGWTIKDDKLFCREAYIDGEAVVKHLANAGPIVGKMIDAGAVKLDSIELHGPKAELEKAKSAADPFGCTYWETYSTWSKFTL